MMTIHIAEGLGSSLVHLATHGTLGGQVVVEETGGEAILEVGDKLPHRRHGARSGHGEAGMFDEVVLVIGLATRVELLLVLRGKEDVHKVTERTLVGGTHLGQLRNVEERNIVPVGIDEAVEVGRGSLGR